MTYHKGIDWDRVLSDALRDGRNAPDLARSLGVAPSSVHSACKARGVTLARGIGGRAFNVKLDRAMDDRYRRAAIDGVSANAFCISEGISFCSLKKLERAHGFKLSRGLRRIQPAGMNA